MFSNFYAIGVDISYCKTTFRLKWKPIKILPNDSLHDKEKLTFHNLSLGLYNRFNFGKRGNYIGNFLDLGAKVDLPFYVVHFTKDKIDVATNNGRIVKTRTTALTYINPIYYNAFFRFGINKYVITGSYRLSDLFKGNNKYTELPVMTLGIEIGMHK